MQYPSFPPFSFFAFSPFAFCFFAFVIMRLPKTISLQVGRKLADKTKDEIMTEVLQVSRLRMRSSVSPSPLWSTFGAAKSSSGKHLFGFWCSILWGGPLLRACTFAIFPSRRTTDPWRLHSRPMVQSRLTKRRLFFPIKTSLMVPGFLMSPYLEYYPLLDGGRVLVLFVVLWSTPCLQSLCRSGPQIGKLP